MGINYFVNYYYFSFKYQFICLYLHFLQFINSIFYFLFILDIKLLLLINIVIIY